LTPDRPIPPVGMDAIRTEGLTKHYDVGFWRRRPYVALDGLTLRVGQGEVFGFLGPNGAGKTTTLKLLMQLIYPTAGHAEILGKAVGDLSVRRRIGYLPENPYFYDNLTGEELLVYFARVFGYSSSEGRQRATRLLDEVGIGAERRFALRRYSKGMIQRVGIAQALINDPELVFLDEPMSGLDPLGRHEVRELILRLRDRGCTVFFSSHVLSDAEALCSRVAILTKGRLAAAGSLDELIAFQAGGWVVVVSGMAEETLNRVRHRIVSANRLGDGRFSLELSPSTRPEPLIADLATSGVRVVSLNPLRTTLEDVFIDHVRAASGEREVVKKTS
jgi:ABC-2 type transport system ATP-binding protein